MQLYVTSLPKQVLGSERPTSSPKHSLLRLCSVDLGSRGMSQGVWGHLFLRTVLNQKMVQAQPWVHLRSFRNAGPWASVGLLELTLETGLSLEFQYPTGGHNGISSLLRTTRQHHLPLNGLAKLSSARGNCPLNSPSTQLQKSRELACFSVH